MLLADLPAIAAGLEILAANDADLAPILAKHGPLSFTLKPGGFPGLLRIILGQQVSVQSAEALWSKLTNVINPLTPETLLAAGEDALRAAGLSRQKTRYARGLAYDILSGSLDLASVAVMEDEAAITSITASVGLGRWTAENYLMFCEGRPDMFPAKDLAILIGLQMLRGGAERPTPIEAWTYAERWRPYRTAASLLIWHNYTGEIAARRRMSSKQGKRPPDEAGPQG